MKFPNLILVFFLISSFTFVLGQDDDIPGDDELVVKALDFESDEQALLEMRLDDILTTNEEKTKEELIEETAQVRQLMEMLTRERDKLVSTNDELESVNEKLNITVEMLNTNSETLLSQNEELIASREELLAQEGLDESSIHDELAETDETIEKNNQDIEETTDLIMQSENQIKVNEELIEANIETITKHEDWIEECENVIDVNERMIEQKSEEE